MVADTWNWTTPFVFTHFGWKALTAVVLNTWIGVAVNYRYLKKLAPTKPPKRLKIPFWIIVVHLITLALIVLNAHHPKVFFGIFLFFIGFSAITQEYQQELKLKQSLLVAFFLGGLVMLGGLQSWWLEPLIQSLDSLPLFLGAAILTSFTDNAAITYLGSQVPHISEAFKYALVAGAVAGGGLTVIANAPNPAGFSILKDSFGPEGINPVKLFLGALIPTLIAMSCLWLLP
jgi:hypothetical protein